MTQEDKELLLRDLCARLSYGVKLWHESYVDLITLHSIDATHCGVEISIDSSDIGTPWWNNIEQVKPYLFPLSSMTEEQQKELYSIQGVLTVDFELEEYKMVHLFQFQNVIDWFNKNHFDYRNLINKNLAIDCTNINIY